MQRNQSPLQPYAQFEFNKIYNREIQHEDSFYTEFLFLHPDGNSYMMYNLGYFYIVNKGNTINLQSFDSVTFLKPVDSSVIFHVSEYYMSGLVSYLLLQEGIMKFYDEFNTAYGNQTTTIALATPSLYETQYLEWQKEIKNSRKGEIIDWRFL